MRALVTGAQGFVGRFLLAELFRVHPDAVVVGIGRSHENSTSFTHTLTCNEQQVTAPLPDALSRIFDHQYSYVVQDICDREGSAELLRTFRPSVIFHMASSLRDEPMDRLCRSNIEGTADLFAAIADSGIKLDKFVLGSSGGVYGIPGSLPIVETDRTNPIDLYSVSKLASENVSLINARQLAIPLAIARIFNVVGPGQDERHACGRFASQLVHAMEHSSALSLDTGLLDPTRDFIDVRDVASAVVHMASTEAPDSIFNVASGIELSIKEVLDAQISLAGVQTTITEKYRRPSDIPRHYASISALNQIGWQPQFSIEASLTDLMNYYVELYR